jgi:hypothetical protein
MCAVVEGAGRLADASSKLGLSVCMCIPMWCSRLRTIASHAARRQGYAPFPRYVLQGIVMDMIRGHTYTLTPPPSFHPADGSCRW